MSDDLPPEEGRAPSRPPQAAESREDGATRREPPRPDGIGLRLDDVRALVNEKNGVTVPPDDPLLVAVTIHNAFLQEHERLFKRHEKALAQFMDGQAKLFVKGVEGSLAPLSETLSVLTAKGIREAVAGFSARLGSFHGVVLLCTAIQALAALLIVAALFLGGRHG